MRVALANGERVTPAALADDDPDDFVLACLDALSPARSVAVDAGLFFHVAQGVGPE